MIRNLSLFLGMFVLGAVIALAARSIRHDPHANHAQPPSQAGALPQVAPKASSPAAAAPTTQHDGIKKSDVVAPAAAGHDHSADEKQANAPVNSVCAICGMDVDPTLPTAQYEGQTIAFGCRMCPPKFKADPEKYGPYYLRNEVMPR